MSIVGAMAASVWSIFSGGVQARRPPRRQHRRARRSMQATVRAVGVEGDRVSRPGSGTQGPKPVEVSLTKAERESLRADLRRRRMSYERAKRSKVILTLGEDPCVSSAAMKLEIDRKDVRKWRGRYLAEGRKGLNCRHRTGRKSRIDPASRCALISTACGRPKDFGVAHRAVWTADILLETYRSLHPDLDQMSRSSLLRVLNGANIRPVLRKYPSGSVMGQTDPWLEVKSAMEVTAEGRTKPRAETGYDLIRRLRADRSLRICIGTGPTNPSRYAAMR